MEYDQQPSLQTEKIKRQLSSVIPEKNMMKILVMDGGTDQQS